MYAKCNQLNFPTTNKYKYLELHHLLCDLLSLNAAKIQISISYSQQFINLL